MSVSSVVSRLTAVVVLSALTWAAGRVPAAPASPELVLAETGAGPVTARDLWISLKVDKPVGHVRPGNEMFAQVLRQRVRDLATDRIVSAEAQSLGLLDEPEIRGRLLWSNWVGLLTMASRQWVIPRQSVTREDVSAEFERRESEFRLAPRAAWRHIFLRASGPEEMAQARARADDLMAQLRSGADFNALAAQYSQAQALSQPLVEYRGRFLPELVQAIDAAPLGEPQGPIETPVGVFIIVVDQREMTRFVPRTAALTGLAMELVNQDQIAARQRAMAELRPLWDARVQRHPEAATGSDPDAPVLTLDDLTLTARDYRDVGPLAVALSPDPIDWAPDSRVALREIADQMILIQAYREGPAYDPVAVANEQAYHHHEDFEELVKPAVLRALRSQIPDDELRRFYEARRSDLDPVDLYRLEEVTLSPEQLIALAGGNTQAQVQRVRDDLLRRAQAAESLRALVAQLDLAPRPEVQTVLTTPQRAGSDLAPRLQRLAAGDIVPPASDFGGLPLIKIISVERGAVPPLEFARPQLLRLYYAAHPGERRSDEEILSQLVERYGCHLTPALEQFISGVTQQEAAEWGL